MVLGFPFLFVFRDEEDGSVEREGVLRGLGYIHLSFMKYFIEFTMIYVRTVLNLLSLNEGAECLSRKHTSQGLMEDFIVQKRLQRLRSPRFKVTFDLAQALSARS